MRNIISVLGSPSDSLMAYYKGQEETNVSATVCFVFFEKMPIIFEIRKKIIYYFLCYFIFLFVFFSRGQEETNVSATVCL